MEETLEHGVPELRAIRFPMLVEALKRGWADMVRSPLYSFMFASAYVAIGLVLAYVTWLTGQTYWLIFAAVGFPLVGPFAACGFYEVSRCLEKGEKLDPAFVCGVVIRQGKRQLPSLCAIIIMVFLFWFFIAHMIFALFLGLSTMTNVSSSYEIYTTTDGLMMLAVGTIVGAAFAMLLFMITVISMPLLHDREVDFVTAMITSFQTVMKNPVPMIFWALIISLLTFIAMIPAFLGLYLALPLLGHASWHLYDQIAIRE
ncbi:DUF2189 domain-containing protein [Alisedimentitalea sp. MJ-SS2]|uniref:DUF2189 domain-containing protein n=1 Tax=Aliisedimentitalea sp. MJ-SS2 TaxID=3049795 RepID=UPI00290A5B24|nr:DUF2189 domain-containing protein [Alisedimentitalea sp. MJ-SS2]MDU8926453.1 DUF2189 domain-containing protein [Alisedimentitalea sp. MJ-SS2]